MRDTDDEARDCFAVAVSPLSTDDFPVLVDLGGAPFRIVGRVVLGAVHVRLPLEAEREDASPRFLLLCLLRADTWPNILPAREAFLSSSQARPCPHK